MIKDEKQTMLSKGKTPKGKILGFDGQKSPTPLENLRSLTGRAGFTMLELLIVIAIIGIIASILLVSFKGALERARIARGWMFSDSLRASLQADMVAWWPLDMIYAGSPPTTPDVYFNQLHGTIVGNVTPVEGIVNNALKFDGNDYIETPLNPSTTATQLRNAFTIEMWIKPDMWDSDYADQILYSAESTTNAFIVFYYFGQTGPSGLLSPYFSINGGWKSCGGGYYPPVGQWSHIVITWDKNLGVFKYYRDSKLLSYCSYGSGAEIGNPNRNIWIGRGWQGTFKGSIDDVRIYSGALPSAVIQQHYAEGLKRHQNIVLSE